jgi:hypothetical protein
VESCKSLLTFGKNMLPTSSGQILKAVDTSEMLISIYQNKRCHIPDDSNIEYLKQRSSNSVKTRPSNTVHIYVPPPPHTHTHTYTLPCLLAKLQFCILPHIFTRMHGYGRNINSKQPLHTYRKIMLLRSRGRPVRMADNLIAVCEPTV